jgi:hypothetical protein
VGQGMSRRYVTPETAPEDDGMSGVEHEDVILNLVRELLALAVVRRSPPPAAHTADDHTVGQLRHQPREARRPVYRAVTEGDQPAALGGLSPKAGDGASRPRGRREGSLTERGRE